MRPQPDTGACDARRDRRLFRSIGRLRHRHRRHPRRHRFPFVVTAFNAAPSGGNPQLLLHFVSGPAGSDRRASGNHSSLHPWRRLRQRDRHHELAQYPGAGHGPLRPHLPRRSPCPESTTPSPAAAMPIRPGTSPLISPSGTTAPSRRRHRSRATGDPDTDLDGIADSVDTPPATPSNAFDDGTGTPGRSPTGPVCRSRSAMPPIPPRGST